LVDKHAEMRVGL